VFSKKSFSQFFSEKTAESRLKKSFFEKNFFEEQQILNKNIVFSKKSFSQFFSEKTAESRKKSFIERKFY
jgi:hypothetical protein